MAILDHLPHFLDIRSTKPAKNAKQKKYLSIPAILLKGLLKLHF